MDLRRGGNRLRLTRGLERSELERGGVEQIGDREGEQQAAEKLLEAARMLAQQPQAMQLRFLQTLALIAGDKSNTSVFPVPVDIIGPIVAGLDKLREKIG